VRDAICNFIDRATPFKACCEADDGVAAIEKAKTRKTGARALRGVMEEAMLDIMYHLPDRQHLKKVVITREVIERTGEPFYVYGEERQRRAGLG